MSQSISKVIIIPVEEPNEGYPIEMIDAGEKYLKRCSMDNELHLPGLFNWHKFISEMLKAIK